MQNPAANPDGNNSSSAMFLSYFPVTSLASNSPALVTPLLWTSQGLGFPPVPCPLSRMCNWTGAALGAAKDGAPRTWMSSRGTESWSSRKRCEYLEPVPRLEIRVRPVFSCPEGVVHVHATNSILNRPLRNGFDWVSQLLSRPPLPPPPPAVRSNTSLLPALLDVEHLSWTAAAACPRRSLEAPATIGVVSEEGRPGVTTHRPAVGTPACWLSHSLGPTRFAATRARVPSRGLRRGLPMRTHRVKTHAPTGSTLAHVATRCLR